MEECRTEDCGALIDLGAGRNIDDMQKLRRSPGFRHYQKTLQCPNGHRRALNFNEGEGEVVTHLSLRERLLLEHPATDLGSRVDSIRSLNWLREKNHDLHGALRIERFRIDSAIECLVCHESWPVFLRRFEILHEHPARWLTTPLGTDVERMDNSRSTTETTMANVFKRKQSWQVEVSWREMRRVTSTGTISVKAPIGPVGLGAQLTAGVEKAITEGHRSVAEESIEFEKAVTHVVPAGTIALVTVEWRQKWHEIEYDVRLDGDSVVRIPVRIADELVADHTFEHLPGEQT